MLIVFLDNFIIDSGANIKKKRKSAKWGRACARGTILRLRVGVSYDVQLRFMIF